MSRRIAELLSGSRRRARPRIPEPTRTPGAAHCDDDGTAPYGVRMRLPLALIASILARQHERPPAAVAPSVGAADVP